MQIAKRFAVTIVGVLLLLAGAALMVLPGPGIVLVVAGLAVLATEYVWAKKLVVGAREQAERAQQEAVSSPLRTTGSFVFALGLVAVGILMLVVKDVSWPFLDSIGDAFWGTVTGVILIVSGLVLMTTTALTLRSARADPNDSATDPATETGREPR